MLKKTPKPCWTDCNMGSACHEVGVRFQQEVRDCFAPDLILTVRKPPGTPQSRRNEESFLVEGTLSKLAWKVSECL